MIISCTLAGWYTRSCTMGLSLTTSTLQGKYLVVIFDDSSAGGSLNEQEEQKLKVCTFELTIVSFRWNSDKVKEFDVVYMRMLFTKQGKQPTTKPSKRKARRSGPEVTVDTQSMISGNIYQTWLKDTSSLVSKRRRVSSVCQCVIALELSIFL